MILSSLVNPDPEGYIRLDENLGRHIGPENVDAFHAEAGDLAINEFLNNPNIVREMMANTAIVEELNTAVAKNFKAPTAAGIDSRNLVLSSLSKKTLTSTGVETFPSMQARAIIANEIITNPIVNDATMRNPVIMRELTGVITNFYKSKSGGGGAVTVSKAGTTKATATKKRGPKK